MGLQKRWYRAGPIDVSSRADTGSPRWSPDGERIGYDSNSVGHFELYEVDANGGQARRSTTITEDIPIGPISPNLGTLQDLTSRLYKESE